ncbi:MAG: hypothetical protein ACK4UO_12660 [Pseudolabrys sp.]
MALLAHQPARPARARRRGGGHNPLLAPILLFAAVVAIGVAYVAYVLWPRWPEVPVARNAPSLPIVVAGTAFNIEPAAIRQAVQRKPGAQDRIDLAYLWPSLLPPDPGLKPTVGAPVDPNERLFVTIQSGELTLAPMERVQTIYPRYLADETAAGPQGLSIRAFRDGTAYQGEDLVFETQAPEHFVARCTRHGVVNAGSCLLERRVGEADVTIRFPRDWLGDWENLAAGIDKLMARLVPQP